MGSGLRRLTGRLPAALPTAPDEARRARRPPSPVARAGGRSTVDLRQRARPGGRAVEVSSVQTSSGRDRPSPAGARRRRPAPSAGPTSPGPGRSASPLRPRFPVWRKQRPLPCRARTAGRPSPGTSGTTPATRSSPIQSRERRPDRACAGRPSTGCVAAAPVTPAGPWGSAPAPRTQSVRKRFHQDPCSYPTLAHLRPASGTARGVDTGAAPPASDLLRCRSSGPVGALVQPGARSAR